MSASTSTAPPPVRAAQSLRESARKGPSETPRDWRISLQTDRDATHHVAVGELHLSEAKDSALDSRPRSSLPSREDIPSPDSRSSWRPWVSVFIKWFLLLTCVGIIGYGLWSWTVPSPAKSNSDYHLAAARIAELEDFSRTTTKMMQVQVELVDMKIDAEIEGLRKHLEESIADERAALYIDLWGLNVRTSEVESSLLKLRNAEHITKQEVVDLVNRVVDVRGSKGQDGALSLDDVRAAARRIVEMEIEKHAADGLGRVDYALSMGGARVIQHSEAYWLGHGMSWQGYVSNALVSLLRDGTERHLHPYAAKVLEPSFGEPGQCLPLKGDWGYVDIALRESIFVEAVTLEHVAKSVAYDRSTAIKDFRIFGWLDSRRKDFNQNAQQIFLLGEFSYDLGESNVQSFDVPTESTGKLVNTIRLEVLSNHGSYSQTCIYRLRVHGSPPKILMPVDVLHM